MIPEQFYVCPYEGDIWLKCANPKCLWEEDLSMGWVQIGVILEKAKKHLEEIHNELYR